MKFTIHQNSRPGARPYNQDRIAYSYNKDALLAVVADGMGGHRHGEIAAQLAVKTLAEAFERMAMPTLKNPAQFLRDYIFQVHEAIDNFMLANDLLDSPRTTIVAAVLQNNKLYCAHAGDSRLYHFRDGRLLYRTEDHSIVQMLYNRGQITQEEMLSHPDRNKVYNCLGGEKTPDIEVAEPRALRDGDILLLCTDGLWSAMDEARLGEILHAGSISETLPQLLNTAESLSAKHGDNLSAIGLQWGDHLHDLFTVSTLTMPLGSTTTIMNPMASNRAPGDDEDTLDLTDDEIERAIAEIQVALHKTKR
jgi:serine/threonine protein phosphatase PrpC